LWKKAPRWWLQVAGASKASRSRSRLSFEAMNRAIELHRLRPVIDRVFAFSEAKEAYRYFGQMTHMGKVVIAGA